MKNSSATNCKNRSTVLHHVHNIVKYDVKSRATEVILLWIWQIRNYRRRTALFKAGAVLRIVYCNYAGRSAQYKRIKIPSHLTSVPAPKLVYGTDELAVLAVQEAMDRGILPKLDYPCTAHIMVYWKA